MAVLKLMKGGNVGQILPLSGDRMVLGRHPSCQIVLDNAAISRQHAQILESHGTYFLEDLRSRNGTHLNEAPVRGRVELTDGDEVKLCDFVFLFLESGSGTALRSIGRGGKNAEGRARETATHDININDQILPLVDMNAEPKLEGSSIISSMEAESVRTVRLNVRPEVKLRALLQIMQSLGRVIKLDDVLPGILDALFKIFPQADWGFVLLKDNQTDRLRLRASKSRYVNEDADVPLSMTIVQQAMDGGRALLSADALRDRRFAASESLADLQIRSVMCAPLLNQAGVSLGVIQVSTRDLEQQFSSDDLELLANVSTQCGMAIENANLHESLLAQRDLDRELEFATQVQLGFLPSEPPKEEGYEFADFYEPAHHVGGDYFDYIRLPNGRIAICIGDVAGKGVPAALLMARLHASARYHLLSALTAAEALTSLNAEIMSSGLGYRFITLALAVIDPQRHVLHLASAGHLPPILRHVDGTVQTLGIKESGMPLGVTTTQNYREVEIPIGPGETIVLYTDGITEAMNNSQEIFGRARLAELLSEGPQSVGEFVPHLVGVVEKFCDGSHQRDDICVVALRRQGGNPVRDLNSPSTAQMSTIELADE